MLAALTVAVGGGAKLGKLPGAEARYCIQRGIHSKPRHVRAVGLDFKEHEQERANVLPGVILGELLNDEDDAVSQRAMKAMLRMVKLDIKQLKAAAAGR